MSALATIGGLVPLSAKQRLRRAAHPVRLGVLRRPAPISDRGWGRGTPIDRLYIEDFLAAHASDVRGRVLEVQDSAYTQRFDHGVVRADVLDLDSANPRATLVADLCAVQTLPQARFDCLIVTQTLQYVRDIPAAIAGIHRMLADGGVVLATIPAIAQPDHGIPRVVDRWRLMPEACVEAFAAVFGSAHTTARPYGNALAAIGFLSGLAQEELDPASLQVADAAFPLLTGVRAVRPARDRDTP